MDKVCEICSGISDPKTGSRIERCDCWRSKMLKVVAAAVYLDGKIYSKPAPARHWNVIHWMAGELGLGPQTGAWEEGFLLSDGRFARRKPAWIIAERAGQIIRQSGPYGTLFSEDVW